MARPKACDNDPSYRQEGGGAGRALKKRLLNGRLTLKDQELIRRVTIIRARRREGWAWPQVAAEVDPAMPWRKLSRFAGKGLFTVIERWQLAQERGELARESLPASAATAEVRVPSAKEHRGTLARLVPMALLRLEKALVSGLNGGVLVESKVADHAMHTVLTAAGLTEPEGGTQRPVIHIQTLVIQSLSEQIRDDDGKIAGREVDITPEAASA